MAVSAAAYYEVRWRAKGSDEAWGLPQRVAPLDEVVVTNLDRTQEYEFEVRAVSNCGAKSIWVPSDYTVPDAPPGTIRLDDLSADAAEALAAIANIASDNILSAGEKPVVIRDTNVITTEQAGIDAQATAYGITTEKTAYDGKVSALTSYLATLTTPTLWSDLSGDTTIVGATFRSKFADVYTSRQTLLNAIYAAAKAKADAAKDAADDAQDTANQGVSLATSMAVINGGFETLPLGYGWTADSGAGWITSNDSGTPGVAPNGAKRVAGSGGNTGAYRNNGVIGCQPGQVIAAQALIKTVGMTGTAYVFISWLNAALGEIGTTPGNQITGTTTAGSYAVGTAPTGTVYARVCLGYSAMTAGTVYADNVVCTQRPSSVDEIPDGQTYTRAVQQSTSETVTNGNFQLPKNGDGSIPGWVAKDSTLNLSTAGPLIGTQSLSVVIAAGKLNAGVQSIKKYQCGAGDSFRVAANAYTNSGANPWVGLFYYDAADGFVGNGAAASSGAGWVQVVAVSSPPAGAVYARLIAYQPGSSGGQFALVGVTLSRIRSIDTEVQDGTVYGRTSQNDLYVSGGVNRVGLRVAGSGHRIGDQRNMPTRTTTNFAANLPTVINYSIPTGSTSPVSVSCSCPAWTLNGGSYTTSYSASSTSISLPRGATTPVYFYMDDPAQSGGAKTLLATTSADDAYTGDGRMYLGAKSITVPSSGSGSGSGGGGGSGRPPNNPV